MYDIRYEKTDENCSHLSEEAETIRLTEQETGSCKIHFIVFIRFSLMFTDS